MTFVVSGFSSDRHICLYTETQSQTHKCINTLKFDALKKGYLAKTHHVILFIFSHVIAIANVT